MATKATSTFVITSIALFMVTLDSLVVTTALAVIRTDLGATIEQLEWTVNAYTLSYAVLLLTGAAIGDRIGRRLALLIGLAIFTFASAAAALAPSTDALIAARAVQGAGGAIVTPLTLTILSAALPVGRRDLALGAWGAIAGLAVVVAPLVGGAVVEGVSWQWIFWLNVPIGLLILPLARSRLEESLGPYDRIDVRGLALASAGLLGVVFALIRASSAGWASLDVGAPLACGLALLAAFVWWELRAPAPMLPMRLFRGRTFALANASSLLMFFGMFGSIFLLAQFLQTAQGHSALEAGVRILPWTAMLLLVAPIAGVLSQRLGAHVVMASGLALQACGLAWMAAVTSTAVPYATLAPSFVVAGIGMALFLPPVASLILGAVRREEEGVASGANNAIRQLGAVLGVAVLSSVFSAYGGYASPATFVEGLTPALRAGAIALAAAALAALAIPRPAAPATPSASERSPRLSSFGRAALRRRGGGLRSAKSTEEGTA